MITLLTHPNTFSLSTIKESIKKYTGRMRGPMAVLKSLERGLKKSNIIFNTNPIFNFYDTVHVVCGADTLNWAIKLKERGKIKKLIAGPSIGVHANDYNFILSNKNIDLIITPSEWVKDLYDTENPEIKNKTVAWPAGVEIPEIKSLRHYKKALIFYKNGTDERAYRLKNICEKNNFETKIIKYGKFKHDDYINELNQSDFMIYMSNSESQGIALSEAWIRDVPTLVISNGVWIDTNIKKSNYAIYVWKNPKISAPYMDESMGSFIYIDEAEKKNLLDTEVKDFIEKIDSYNPRRTSINTLSDDVCIKKYLDIIEKL